MKTTIKDIRELVNQIAALTNQSSSHEDAVKNGHDKYLFVEHAAHYGGYRVVNVALSSGGHSGAFGGNGCEGRVSGKEMYAKLDGILIGIQLTK